jgi:hypothetical protein
MRTLTRIIVVTLFVVGPAIGCDREKVKQAEAPWTPSTTQPVSSTQPAAKGPEYLNVLGAVFRYQFDHNASSGQRHVDYFFLTLDQSDPPPECSNSSKVTRRASYPRQWPRLLRRGA